MLGSLEELTCIRQCILHLIHVCISKGNVVYEVQVIIVAVELQGQMWKIYSRISSLGHIATSVVLHLFLFFCIRFSFSHNIRILNNVSHISKISLHLIFTNEAVVGYLLKGVNRDHIS